MKDSTSNSIGDSLWNLCNQVGIPHQIIANLAKAQEGVKTKFYAAFRKLRIKLHWYEKGRHQQNYKVEGEINVVQRKWKVLMTKQNVPKQVWYFGLILCAEIIARTAHRPDSCTSYKDVTGNMTDISSWLDFTFFDLVCFWKDAKWT